jgi:CRISPR system Cascade subunit CasE
MNELVLSALAIDPRQTAPRNDLKNSAGMHRRVMSLFDSGLGGTPRSALNVLYRLETHQNGPRLLIQSTTEPNTSTLANGYSLVGSTLMGRLAEQLVIDTVIRYRIVANATKKIAAGDHRGKRVALNSHDTNIWWANKAAESGLDLIEAPTLHPETTIGRDATDGVITIRPWRIDGHATVVNPEKTVAAIHSGLGRGKAYGCGLLSVAIAR